MIKAEVINHEGSAGPNWLDHCRAVFTPQTLTTLFVILVVIIAGLAFTRQHAKVAQQTGSLGASSQQVGFNGVSSPRLQVATPASSIQSSTTDPTTSSNLQPANNAGDAALPGTPTTSLGTGSATVGPASNDSGNSLQSVINAANQTVQGTGSTVSGLLNIKSSK
jgi:hypothetical protein